MSRILVVEDNEPNRNMVSRHLKREGYEVLLAVDGAEAIEVAQADRRRHRRSWARGPD